MAKQKQVKVKLFVKEGCSTCQRVKDELGGLLNDLSAHINLEIITTNPQVVKENKIEYAPTMRFDNSTDGQLVGGQITTNSILEHIRKLKFGK